MIYNLLGALVSGISFAPNKLQTIPLHAYKLLRLLIVPTIKAPNTIAGHNVTRSHVTSCFVTKSHAVFSANSLLARYAMGVIAAFFPSSYVSGAQCSSVYLFSG